MRVLFFGAGAFGTLFGAKLCFAGHDVSILARGDRFDQIKRDGLCIRQRDNGEVSRARPRVVAQVADATAYDLVVVLVRRPQVDAALRSIAAEHGGDVLVMVNEARGYDPWRAILGTRLLVGFGGAMAAFDESGVLSYKIAPRVLQPTVLGEPDGRVGERLRHAARLLRGAGFPVQVRRDMQAWQQTHAAWITPFMLVSAFAARKNDARLSAEHVDLWAGATREGLCAVRRAGARLVPPAFRGVLVGPQAATASLLRAALHVEAFRTQLLASGASSADEGLALEADLTVLAGKALPNLRALADAVR